MDQSIVSLLKLVARYYSPFALPRQQVAESHATRREKARIRRNNLLYLRPFMRRYIFRSGQLVVGCFIASILFASLLPLPMLAVAASIGLLLAVLHTVVLIFMQQWINELADRKATHDHTSRP